MLAEISLVQSAGLAAFEVSVQDREAALDFVLGEFCVEKVETALDFGVTLSVGRNLVAGEVARTRQDWVECLHRKAACFDFSFRKDEIFVVAGCQAALDVKEISNGGSASPGADV